MQEIEYIPQGNIYKYTSAEGAIATLENNSFKFNCPLEFNDPFDCNMSILRFSVTQSSIDEFREAAALAHLPRNERRKMERELNDPVFFQKLYKRLVSEKIAKSKVTCFSKTYSNTLMWSHYANQHRGISLEFNGSMEPSDILDRGVATILNVNYDRTDVVTINYNEEKEKAIVDLFTRKSSDWRYEEEVRIIVMDDSKYHKFNKPFLTGIIFGCRTAEDDKKKALAAIKRLDYNVRVQQAIKGPFKLEFKDILH